MILSYEERKENLRLVHMRARHVPPHIHHAIEFVYVTEGTLELGIAQELYHMEKGDLGCVFPDMIHHYQVFSAGKSKAYFIHALPTLAGPFQADLGKYCPANPVIKAKDVHVDIRNALRHLSEAKERNLIVDQAYIQIILARSIPCYKMVDKSVVGGRDIIYQVVAYIAGHFQETVTLDIMAKELGISRYALSRVFSSTFHTNFNQYLNEQRLVYASTQLECTDQSITDICMDAGFESQRTFNRVFQEKYKMTPREYRKFCKEKYIINENEKTN